MARKTTLSALLVLAACGGGGASSGGGGPDLTTGPATVAAYCDLYWTELAGRWAACERGSAAYYAAIYAPALRCGDAVQAVTAGRASYDRGHAGACLAYVETASCDALEALLAGRSPQADCLAAVAGKGAAMAECYSSESCASDLCIGSPSACPSVCVTPTAQGAPCSGVPCARGLFCDIFTLPPSCQPLEAQNATCWQDGDCQPGLRCDYSGGLNGTCQPRRTTGDCAADSTCAIGYECVGAPSGTCVRRLSAGDPCTQGTNACGPGLWCGPGATGTCIDGPTATQPCSMVNGEWLPCIGGWCNAGHCAAWAEGTTCSLPGQCAPTASCDSSACTTLCAEP